MTEPVPARAAALDALRRVLDRGQPLDEALDTATRGLEPRERRFVHAIALASLRHKGSIEHLIERYLSRPLPKSGRDAHLALLSGAAQLLFLGSPAHAVVNEQVNLIGERSKFRGVVNAVLRRFDRDGRRQIADPKTARRDLPGWLAKRWSRRFGQETADRIAETLRHDSVPLDITVKSDPDDWAQRLGGSRLPTGSIRLAEARAVPDLPGFEAGDWWVQDAAAALPVRLFGDIAGKSFLDGCAAPGGKTAQAAANGAAVTALDRSPKRLKRLSENLSRLGLEAETVASDFREFADGRTFDAVLLDAPCTATGTLRRHPDIGWLRSESDVEALAAVQTELLDHAADLVAPGGTLVYCTCSLEPEEGEAQIEGFLGRRSGFRREPVDPAALGLPADAVSDAGDLRTLPCHFAEAGGMDGFFAARLVRA